MATPEPQFPHCCRSYCRAPATTSIVPVPNPNSPSTLVSLAVVLYYPRLLPPPRRGKTLAARLLNVPLPFRPASYHAVPSTVPRTVSIYAVRMECLACPSNHHLSAQMGTRQADLPGRLPSSKESALTAHPPGVVASLRQARPSTRPSSRCLGSPSQDGISDVAHLHGWTSASRLDIVL